MRTEQPAIDYHVAQIADVGYSIIEDAIEPELLAEINEALERLEHELPVGPGENLFEGVCTVRIYNLLAHGTVFTKIPTHPLVLAIAERVLDPGLLISSLSSIAIGPGESAQPIHADDQVIPLPKPHPPTVCNTMWALTDFTEANGATRVIPGSHLATESPSPFQQYDSIAAEMRQGSVLIWHGSLWHGGGANTTDQRRVGIAMNYCAGYVRQQENQQLGLDQNLVQSFSHRLQQLVGYGLYNGLIGHIDKEVPSRLLLGDEEESFMLWDYAKPPPKG